MKATFAFLFFSIVLSSSAFAYDINDLISDAKAYHSKHQHELGDMTLELTGTFTAPGSGESSMQSKRYQKGDKWRMESMMDMQGMGNANGKMETISLYDGENLWSVAMGMKTKLTKEQSQNQDANSYWNPPPEGSKIVGEETINDRDCWIIEYPANIIMKTPPRYWIDKKHFVFVRSESELSGKKIRTDFSDFRKVKDDFELPYLIETSSDGKKSMIVNVTKLETNTGLSNDLFNPEKLQGTNMGGMNMSGQGGMQTMDMDSLMKAVEEMQRQMQQQNQGR